MYFDAKLRALEELNKSGVAIEITKKFQRITVEAWEPLPPREAVDFFNRKVTAKIVTRKGEKRLIVLATQKALPFFDKRAFAVAGEIRDDILNDIKQILLTGIRKQDEAGSIKGIRSLFNKYVEQGIEINDKLLQPHRINTIVRTNIVEAVNAGRAAMYQDPDVEGFVQFWEYSAILDARTTDYCRCMDGKIFGMEDLDILHPPAHYNCRSISVPISLPEVEALKARGRGIELDQPCPDRAAGFADLKTPTLEMLPDELVDIIEEDKGNKKPLTGAARLQAQLALIVVRCPYTTCHSDKIKFQKAIFNVGEFTCDACNMPFRVSNTGDIYLFDAGSEVWHRTSLGLVPTSFKEKED